MPPAAAGDLSPRGRPACRPYPGAPSSGAQNIMKTRFAAAAAAFLVAAPAFAAEEYQAGPALTLSDNIPLVDTGSAQVPAFNGRAVVSGARRSPVGNGSESSVDTANSETVSLTGVTGAT